MDVEGNKAAGATVAEAGELLGVLAEARPPYGCIGLTLRRYPGVTLMAQLSTHVLDTSRGQPAANLRIDLYRAGKLVKTVTTNADGRTSEPLLSGDRVPAGGYEIALLAGASFRGLGDWSLDPPVPAE